MEFTSFFKDSVAQVKNNKDTFVYVLCLVLILGLLSSVSMLSGGLKLLSFFIGILIQYWLMRYAVFCSQNKIIQHNELFLGRFSELLNFIWVMIIVQGAGFLLNALIGLILRQAYLATGFMIYGYAGLALICVKMIIILYWLFRTGFAGFIVLNEDIHPAAAVKKSLALTKTYFSKIIKILFLQALLWSIPLLIVMSLASLPAVKDIFIINFLAELLSAGYLLLFFLIGANFYRQLKNENLNVSGV